IRLVPSQNSGAGTRRHDQESLCMPRPSEVLCVPGSPSVAGTLRPPDPSLRYWLKKQPTAKTEPQSFDRYEKLKNRSAVPGEDSNDSGDPEAPLFDDRSHL